MILNDDFSNLPEFEKLIEQKGFLNLWNEFQEKCSNGLNYKQLNKWLLKFEPFGLTFDYGLNSEAYDFEIK